MITLSDLLLKIGTQNVTLSGISVANLTGGGLDNSFTVNGWSGSGTLAAAGGSDSLN